MTVAQVKSEKSGVVVSAEPELMNQALQAFQAGLPDLLRDHRGGWVAFRGKQLVHVFEDYASLDKAIRISRLPADELLIRQIVPERQEVQLNW